MPGIVGCITKEPREYAERQVRLMTQALLHERFYAAGNWHDESLGVYVGWVGREESLAAEGLRQSEKGDVVLVFSGEEFTDLKTKKENLGNGPDVRSGDTSHLIRLYEQERTFPAQLNGTFHGLLADRPRGMAMLFNDRFGMHRIYYYRSKDTFYFAAEAKAILAVCPELRSIDPRSLGEFVSCGAVLDGKTLFKGISVLPPGSAWIFRNRELAQENTFFEPREWEEQDKLSPEDFFRELQSSFMRNLPRYFGKGERIALSLTGGLDTRMVLAGRKPDPGSLPCYTFGSMFRDNEDVRIARRIARIANQSHQVIVAGQEFLKQFPLYAERAVFLTDGCVDVGRAPDLYLNERAREIAPIRMTGNYGSEILRGVRAFKPERFTSGIFQRDFLSFTSEAEATFARLLGTNAVSFAAFRQCPWHHYGIRALEQTQLSMRSPFLDNDFVRTVFRGQGSDLAGSKISMRLIAGANPALLGIPTDRGLGGNSGEPFRAASRAVLEFLFKAEYAYDMGMPQWLARADHSLKALHLERLFLGRHKVFHFRVWYRDALAGFVKEILLDSRSLSRPHVERKGVERAVQDHAKGKGNYTTEIHKLLTIELLYRLFVDGQGNGVRGPRSDSSLSERTNHLATA